MHTRTLTYMLRASSAVLLNVYSMYIEHCCSVGLFGAKFNLYINLIFKYIKQLFYFDEFVCLLSDLTIVVIFIFAGQLWTIGKLELQAKTWENWVWLLEKIEWLLP